jgi:hypothetical protein
MAKSIVKSVVKKDAGGPERTRTSDLRFRKPLLYPAELRDRILKLNTYLNLVFDRKRLLSLLPKSLISCFRSLFSYPARVGQASPLRRPASCRLWAALFFEHDGGAIA